MSRSKLTVAVLTSTLLTTALTGCNDGSPESTDEPVFTMVTDTVGLGDQGFNDLAKAGVDASAEEFGGRASIIQSGSQSQFVPNLQQAAATGSVTITAVGFSLADAVSQVAAKYPKTKFVLIDAVALDENDTPLSNVAGIQFKEQEAAYLAGIVAGMTTETDKLGFVGGMELPSVQRFLTGFTAGVASVNDAATIQTAFLGNFTDSAKGKELATAYFDGGADIVFEVAGAGGLGVYEAAKQRGPGSWVVGVDTCKDQLAPDNLLTSATKDVTGVVLEQNTAAVEGNFKGGEVTLGIAEDAVGLCEDTFGDLPDDVQEAVNGARDAVISGDITVPATAEDLKAFDSGAGAP